MAERVMGIGSRGVEDSTPDRAANAVMDAAALFRAHAGFVAGFLSKMGAPAAELDDLVQDVFLIAHRRGGYRPGQARPTTWLAQIALGELRNLARKSARRRKSRADSPAAVDGAVSPRPDPERAAVHRRALDRLSAVLNEIEPDKRAVFLLFELEGESCTSIAAGLEIPVGTVYSRLHGARNAVRAEFERDDIEGSEG